MLKPLQEWICDECGQVITSVEDGYLEWVRDADDRPMATRIVHHAPASPRGGREGCYAHTNAPTRADMHLEDFVGPDGLTHLLSLIDDGPVHHSGATPKPGVVSASWSETVRRLHIPHYEDARRYFAEAKADGFYDEANEIWPYTQEALLRVIEKYGSAEDDE